MKFMIFLVLGFATTSSFAAEIKIKCSITTIRNVNYLMISNLESYKDSGNTRTTGSPWNVRINGEEVEGYVEALVNDKNRVDSYAVTASQGRGNKFFQIDLKTPTTAVVYQTDTHNKRISEETSNCSVERKQ